MPGTFKEAGTIGSAFVESGLKSFASLSQGAEALAAETSSYTRKSIDSVGDVVGNLLSATSVEAALRIQGDYARQAYESLVAEATKLNALYADLSTEAYRPFESIVAKAE